MPTKIIRIGLGVIEYGDLDMRYPHPEQKKNQNT